MSNISLIWFICLMFLKETRTSISYLALILHQDIKSPSPLRPKNQARLHLCWKQSIRKVAHSNIPGTWRTQIWRTQIDNGSEFKGKVMKLFQKHNVDIQRATTKYKYTHTAFVEAFNKELKKLLFKPMDAQELQNPKKVFNMWVKNLNKIVNKINNTVSSMIGMKPKDAIKLETVPLDRLAAQYEHKKYPEETVLPKDGLYRHLCQPGEQHGDQKRRATDLIWSNNTYRLDQIVQEPDNRLLLYLQDGPDRAFVREELMHISEDTQVPPDWVSEWK